MLSANEMVMETSGLMKTLQEFIKSSSGGVGDWESSTAATLTPNSATPLDLPDFINAALDDDTKAYTDVLFTLTDTVAKSVYNQFFTWKDFSDYIKTADNFTVFHVVLASTSFSGGDIKMWSTGKSDGKYGIKITCQNTLINQGFKFKISAR